MIRLLMMVIALSLPLTACGTKGKLKTPTQIKVQETKKAKKLAREERQQEKENPNMPDATEVVPENVEEAPALPQIDALSGTRN